MGLNTVRCAWPLAHILEACICASAAL